jgi:predicted HicB family RNase H-like nuclease
MKTAIKKKAVEQNKKIVNVKLDHELHQKLEAVSDKEKRSLHSQIIWILESSINKKE